MTNYIPHSYQQRITQFIKNNPKCAIWADMGLGKTVATLTAINDLLFDSFEINKVLIIAPLHVADSTWLDEAKKFEHLKHLKISRILGTEKQRMEALKDDADIYTINKENLQWLVDYLLIKNHKWYFDMIVIDEASMFKNYNGKGSKRFKSLVTVLNSTDKNSNPIVKRVVELTGTPSPKGYENLWSQFYLLDKGERLGNNIMTFRRRYMYEICYSSTAHGWNMRKESYKLIEDKIKDICLSIKWEGNIQMVDRIDNFIKVKLTDDELNHIEEFRKENITEIKSINDLSKDEGTIYAKTQLSEIAKEIQLANGACYITDDLNTSKEFVVLHDEKLIALKNIIENNPNQNIMVFYWFNHDLIRLQEYFKDLNPRTIKSDKDIKDWNNGDIRLLLCHPSSMGHGLNLQFGGSINVWFSLTYDLELYQQANARLYRQGQKNTVIINHLISEGTIDEEICKSLQIKNDRQDKLMKHLLQYCNIIYA